MRLWRSRVLWRSVSLTSNLSRSALLPGRDPSVSGYLVDYRFYGYSSGQEKREAATRDFVALPASSSGGGIRAFRENNGKAKWTLRRLEGSYCRVCPSPPQDAQLRTCGGSTVSSGGEPGLQRTKLLLNASPFFGERRRLFASPAVSAGVAPAPVTLAELDARKLQINKKIGFLHPLPGRESFGFGQVFTDHMIEVDWDDQHGWYPPVLKPLGPVSLHPGISSLHYAISAFEGLKAYRTEDDRVLLFRPFDHGERLNRSCARVALPQFSVDSFVTLCKTLAKMDSRFIIYQDRDLSLYLRPIVFSTYPALGVFPPRMAKMIIMASPTGGYFSNAGALANLFVEKDYTRSWPGGSGSHKVAANYAPTIQPCKERMQQGFQQLLWTVPEGDDYIWCEGGAMSLFLFWKNENGENELATPALERDLILPGIVRDTVLTLARGYPDIAVTERKILMQADFVKAYREGHVHEVFCTGTGAVVKPVGVIHFDGEDFDCAPKDLKTSLAHKLHSDITDIQYGVVPHHFMQEC
ncbi:branched-chain-amino-acid aminotransferase, related [Neospora caninum Liverpool]|uniref:Branched-chain-amino-acid aminotransferase, related n=1 Tax=Neospora caninum (strain Liverpool) TaxID=572307 RepID=F0V910_NEOCL|nr:branched-chain-amino-acid aminotransferase, related [Neospora caninum Liverpool]CBZ50201.1 branched-chain-amino-acid aminotransferase, related [Neospora caninum Liverpool]CEL64802.1 TPA: Branched-chain-amino-acid aminotransferase, related [Neospora caninum Liverpool]|eukprot:XP_003880236.1 branched-chain-amino-acid aminotransferase, related [Neospora caninum Liverpool]